MKKAFFRIIVSALLLSSGIWFYEELVEGFYESAIHLHTWPHANYDTIDSHYNIEKVQTILDQPFTYLGKGRQFFVFASSDGKYVLKFIKCQRIDFSHLYTSVPLPEFLNSKRQKRIDERFQRVTKLFASCKLAAVKLSRNTGVVYAHLSTKPDVKKEITLVDKLGMSHSIVLDNVPFILQKRAQEVMPIFSHALQIKDYTLLNKRFDQLVKLIKSDTAAGVIDIDAGTIARNNVAFLDDSAIHIDIGTFEARDNAQDHLKEQLERLMPLIKWIESKEPSLAQEFKAKIEN